MKRNRLRSRLAKSIPAAALALALLCPAAAMAQDRGFLDNMFNRGDDQQQQQPSRDAPGGGSSDLSVRIDRVEGALRQLTGTVEQLQYQNQQLQMQLKRMQDDANYRQSGPGGGGGAPGGPPYSAPPQQQMAPGQPAPGRRSDDSFDPSRHPNAPGVPRTLGNESIVAPEPAAANAPPVGAPGGREAGAPLDLSSLSGSNGGPPPGMNNGPPGMAPPMQQGSQLPPPPPRNTSATGGQQFATLPPTARPQDEYDLAYGYVQHKDYGLAEQAFRDFLRKYPDERLVPDAQFWMGEALYQQQRYRDAAESFLAVSTKYDHSGKAPDSLLRLGQSLAALNKKEAACATLAEVGRKYPRASASVKRGVTQEQKRVHC